MGGVRVAAWVAVAIVAALFVLMVALAGMMLGRAVVARRRTQALIQGRLAELWEVVGSALDLPEDASKTFAVISVLLIPVAFIVLPVGGGRDLHRPVALRASSCGNSPQPERPVD